MPYEPQRDTLPAQVVGYFRLHPDEHLTLDDIATKFSSGRSNIHTLLARALDAELLKREKSADGEWIYRAGKELKPVAADRARARSMCRCSPGSSLARPLSASPRNALASRTPCASGSPRTSCRTSFGCRPAITRMARAACGCWMRR